MSKLNVLLGDKILVKRVEAETKTKSGIVLPDSAKEKPKRGKKILSRRREASTPRYRRTRPLRPSRKADKKSSSPATPAPKSSWTAKN